MSNQAQSKFGNIEHYPKVPEFTPTYTLERHITPEIKARADAEWLAMDERGVIVPQSEKVG